MPAATWFLAFITIFLLVGPAAEAKRLYTWVDSNGVTHFTDSKPPKHAQEVRPSGMTTIIPMRDNIRTQRRVESIHQSVQRPRTTPSRASSSSNDSYARQREEREKQYKEQQCADYKQRIKWIDRRLRAGGYGVSEGNRLRRERRDLSSKWSWECLRGN